MEAEANGPICGDNGCNSCEPIVTLRPLNDFDDRGESILRMHPEEQIVRETEISGPEGFASWREAALTARAELSRWKKVALTHVLTIERLEREALDAAGRG